MKMLKVKYIFLKLWGLLSLIMFLLISNPWTLTSIVATLCLTGMVSLLIILITILVIKIKRLNT